MRPHSRIGVVLLAAAVGAAVIGMRPLGWWLKMAGVTRRPTPAYQPDERDGRDAGHDASHEGGSDAGTS